MAWPYDDEQTLMTPEEMAAAYPDPLPEDVYTGQTVAPPLPSGAAQAPRWSQPGTNARLGDMLRATVPAAIARANPDLGASLPGASGSGMGPIVPRPDIAAEMPVQAGGPLAPPPPAMAGRMGAPPVRVPDEYALGFGGNYAPDRDEFASELESARLQGRVTPEQAAEAMKRFRGWDESQMGRAAALSRYGVESEEQMADQERQGAERQAQGYDQAIYARQQAMAQAQQAEAQAAEVRAERQDAMKREIQNYRAAVGRIEASRVDPNKFWKDRGTAGQILGAVALGLGALASEWGKTGRNMAAETIDKAIDRDIAAQEKALDTKQTALAARNTLMGHMLDYYGDKERASLASKAFAYESLGMQVENIIASTTRDDVRARGDDMLANIARKREQNELALQQMAAQQRDAQLAALRQAQAAASAKKDTGLEPGEMEMPDQSLYVPGRGGVVKFKGSPEGVAKTMGTLADAQFIRDRVNELRQLHEDKAKWSVDGSGKAKAITDSLRDVFKRQGFENMATNAPNVDQMSVASAAGVSTTRSYLDAAEGLAKAMELSATANMPVIQGQRGRPTTTGEYTFRPDQPVVEIKKDKGKGK